MDGDLDPLDAQPAKGCGPLLADPLSLQKPMRQRVFEYVRAQGSTARSDISHALEISAGSATTLTADLIRAGLLREVARASREYGRGRPRVALEIVPQAGYVVGIKLGGDQHTAVLCDLAGNRVSAVSTAAPACARTVDTLLDEVESLLIGVLVQANMTRDKLVGVGIGMAGIVDHTQGLVHWSPLLDADEQAFGAAFTARFDLPVVLENDANMLALSELWFGAGRDMTDFAVVTIESGVGMGLVLDNQLFRGSFGMGLELGHTKVQMDGALCRCGQRGCLEAYISDYALLREARTTLPLPAAGSTARGPVAMDVLLREAQADNPAARAIFERAGRFLALGLSNVVQLIDPALIILSGKHVTANMMFGGDVLARVQPLTLSRNNRMCQIEVHGHDDLDWARGATARALMDVTERMFTADLAA